MRRFSGLMWSALALMPQVLAQQASAALPAINDVSHVVHARNLRPVTVIGVVPGPDMWRVRRGGHVLWILGTLDELPDHMQWRAREVRQVIAQAGQVLDTPRVRIHASIGYFDRLALNPDGHKLREVVPPQDYAKWARLKSVYMGDDAAVEDHRPVFAAIQLYLASLKRAGLSTKMIEPVIDDLLKQRNLTLTPVIYSVDAARIGDPIGDVRLTREADMDCFEATLEHLPGDLGVMQKRAEAWATGDLEDLAKLPMSDQLDVCRQTLIESGASFKPDMADVRKKLRDAWVAAASSALRSNKTSFAILPMANLFGPDSYLETLRTKGYSVDLPDSLDDSAKPTRAVKN